MRDPGQRFVRCFDAAAEDAGRPNDRALRAALHAYMCWAVGDVLAHSAEGSVLAPGAAMPRWGWDGLQAPR